MDRIYLLRSHPSTASVAQLASANDRRRAPTCPYPASHRPLRSSVDHRQARRSWLCAHLSIGTSLSSWPLRRAPTAARASVHAKSDKSDSCPTDAGAGLGGVHAPDSGPHSGAQLSRCLQRRVDCCRDGGRHRASGGHPTSARCLHHTRARPHCHTSAPQITTVSAKPTNSEKPLCRANVKLAPLIRLCRLTIVADGSTLMPSIWRNATAIPAAILLTTAVRIAKKSLASNCRSSQPSKHY